MKRFVRPGLFAPLFRLARLLPLAFILCSALFFAPARAEAPSPAPVVQESPASASEGFEWKDYQDPALERNEGNPVTNTLGFLLKFGLVVGLIYGVAWLYKKGLIPKGLLAVRPGAGTATGRSGMRVIDSVPLRGAQSLHVVEVGDRVLVVGSNGRETLVKLTEWANKRKRFEALVDDASEGEPELEESDFSEELESTLRRVINREGGSL
ncbi:MAG TPA: flagellar biosynthetic protein FliO [Stenomitos sp.]